MSRSHISGEMDDEFLPLFNDLIGLASSEGLQTDTTLQDINSRMETPAAQQPLPQQDWNSVLPMPEVLDSQQNHPSYFSPPPQGNPFFRGLQYCPQFPQQPSALAQNDRFQLQDSYLPAPMHNDLDSILETASSLPTLVGGTRMGQPSNGSQFQAYNQPYGHSEEPTTPNGLDIMNQNSAGSSFRSTGLAYPELSADTPTARADSQLLDLESKPESNKRRGRPRLYDTTLPKGPPVPSAFKPALAGPIKRKRGAKPKYKYSTEAEAVASRRERNRKTAISSYYKKKQHDDELEKEVAQLKSEQEALHRVLTLIQSSPHTKGAVVRILPQVSSGFEMLEMLHQLHLPASNSY